jgi:hypothetical protein
MIFKDEDGKQKLHRCLQEYDKNVIVVVYGTDGKTTASIALNGVINCMVNDNNGPIEIGDLLTTSAGIADLAGRAMKADPTKSRGSVIGKALKPLKSGSGLIPIVVALQ